MTRKQGSGYLKSRWRGEADFQLLLWRDVLVVGTLINLIAGFAAFILFTRDAAPIWALTVHFSPVPYNVFLLLSVWRSKNTTPLVSLIAAIWFVVVLVI